MALRTPARAATAVLAGLGVAAAALMGAPAAQASTASWTRLVVATADAGTGTAALRAAAGRGASVRRIGGHLVAVGTGERAARAAAALRRVPGVVSVTRDRRVVRSGAVAPVEAKDKWFGSEWDLWDADSSARAGGYGVDAPRAWATTLGVPDVVVAVVDTGSTAHPDLDGAAVLPGYDFVSRSSGVETGDGDGWDADPTDPGDSCAATGDTASWHGTFVSGELAAQHGTSGVAGEAPGVSLLPVRVLGGCGGTESDTAAGIEWAAGGVVQGVPVNPTPAKVINLSLGSSSGPCSTTMQTAIDDAVARGSVVVAATGNDGGSMSGSSPANCSGVISVVATTRSGALAGYANRGTAAMSPTLAAPGGDDDDPVLGDTWTEEGKPAVGGYEGTSMAAPRVAGAIALLLSIQPGLTPAQIRDRLVRTATPFPAGSDCSATTCGAGIVNAGDLVGAQKRFVAASRAAVGGRARVGQRLTATSGRWRPAQGRITYRWLRDGRAILGAVRRTYTVGRRDAGHGLAVVVTIHRAGWADASTTSSTTRVGR